MQHTLLYKQRSIFYVGRIIATGLFYTNFGAEEYIMNSFNAWMLARQNMIILGLVISFIALLAPWVHSSVKTITKPWPSIFRLAALTTLCAVGYSSFGIWGINTLKNIFSSLAPWQNALIASTGFIILGWSMLRQKGD
jgi:hypothetical protein